MLDTITGIVVRIVDGDTFDVLSGDIKVRVRLAEVDAPEKSQPYGPESASFSSNLILSKEVMVTVRKKDLYGRSVGSISVNGEDLAESLVKNGLAWHYSKYSKKNAKLEALENAAREQRVGLWIPSAIAPWDWRKGVHTANVAAVRVLQEQPDGTVVVLSDSAPTTLPVQRNSTVIIKTNGDFVLETKKYRILLENTVFFDGKNVIYKQSQ